MLSLARDGARCIYCAFRAQQLRLRALRTRRHIHLQPAHPRRASNFRVRYTNDGPSRVEEAGRSTGRFRSANTLRETTGRRLKNVGPVLVAAGQPSIVRKFLAGVEQDVIDATKNGGFEAALPQRLHAMRQELKDAPLLARLKADGDAQDTEWDAVAEGFQVTFNRFSSPLLRAVDDRRQSFKVLVLSEATKDAMQRLRDAYTARGQNGLDDRIKHEFYAHITNSRFTPSDIRNQQALADLRYPSEWFPATRSIHRKIHLHVGPTNSGKTYHALQRLEKAETGVYAGPLRLLAHEVYTRMNAKGKSCSLITGEERRLASDAGSSGASMSACTVEMLPLNKALDVAVIDEIQMIGNPERGWAWTQALLGVKAAEVHLCGEERTVPLIREICASLGEKLEIHHYKRLSPLKVAGESLDGALSKLRKGDCVVSFSVMGIHSLRRQIERATGKKVATVYGSLPPETRAQQARLFNDPNNDYDYLVASDAVGMGLNLAIKRIIFEASSKFDGYQHRTLGVADIKQIAGRAGRYRTAAQATQPGEDISKQDLSAAKGENSSSSADSSAPSEESENMGYVTTLQKFDFPIVSMAMESEPEPIHTAGIFPPAPVLERFGSYFPPGTPFSYILTRLHELSQMHSRFHLCGLKDQIWIADLIEPVENLTITDRNIICSCPASSSDRDLWQKLMPAYAKCIAEQSGGNIIDIKELPLEALEADVSASREYLRELERLHKGVVGYLWLSYRFAGVFGPRNLAFHVKSLVEEKIEKVLAQFSFSESSFKRKAKQREIALLRDMEAAAMAAGQQGTADGDVQEVQIDYEQESERELKVEKRNNEVLLRDQTSLTAGGDRFGGEEGFGLEDPLEREDEEDTEPATTTSFAEWRRQQASEDHALERALSTNVEVSQEGTAMTASWNDESDTLSSNTAATVARDESNNRLSDADQSYQAEFVGLSETSTGEQGPRTHEQPTAPSKPLDDGISPSEQVNRLADHNQFGGAPRKHISHLETNVTELERNVDTRP